MIGFSVNGKRVDLDVDASTPLLWVIREPLGAKGLTDAQLCQSIKDPKQNKRRNVDQLVEHLTSNQLVMWPWNPGEDRLPVPMSHDEFCANVKQWADRGGALSQMKAKTRMR